MTGLLMCTIPLHAKQGPAPLYESAYADIAKKSDLKRARASILTDARYQKQKRTQRAERLKQRQDKRLKNYQRKRALLDTHQQTVVAHRSSAMHHEEAGRLAQSKRKKHKMHQEMRKNKEQYIAKQNDIAEYKKTLHAAARAGLSGFLDTSNPR